MSDKHAPPMTRAGAAGPAAGAAAPATARGAELALPPAYLAPLPHEKYQIPEELRDPDMDYLWLPSSIFGEPNKRAIAQHFRMGWVPAQAKDFPHISGYGADYPAELVARGLVDNVRPDDILEVDGLMLVQRPLAVSQMARKQMAAEAADRVNNQFRRLQSQYRANFEGGGVKRAIRPLADEGYSG
jgi:hypothetical protein